MTHTLEVHSLKGQVDSLQQALRKKEKSQRRLSHMVTHDVLTGLLNRYAFKKHIKEYFSSKESKAGKSLSLHLLDLTRFKEINDTLGHDIGDKVLQLVAYELQDCLPACAKIFRLGGDEFAILLKDKDTNVEASQQHVLQQIYKVFRRKYRIKGHRINVGSAVGVCVAPKDASDAEELFKRADIAMYEAKRSGQFNVHRYFNSRIEMQLQQDKASEELILDMIQRKDFTVYFQPKLDVKTELIHGVEVLIRANNSDLVLPALKIIQVAEENNLMVQLGEVIIDRTFKHINHLKQQTNATINIALNISVLQICERFIEKIESCLLENNLSISDVTLEITESVLIDRPELIRERLNYFHSKGIRISIDDFGAGYSSLSYLHHYPLDELKIDRSFISELENNEVKKKIIIGIIKLAHAIDLKVVAKGVETEYQYSFLKSAHCDYVQGHLFYPALPKNKLFEVITSQVVQSKLTRKHIPTV